MENKLKEYVMGIPKRFPSGGMMSKDKRAKALSVIRYADDFVIIHIKEKSKGGNNSDKNLVLIHLPQCLRHLQKAFANFWSKQAKYPRFKKKCNGGSAEFTLSAFKYQEGKLWLAKCKEPLNIVWSRYLPEGCNPSTVTIKLGPSGRWLVSLLVDDYTVKTLPPTKKQVGIDAGITSLISTSDGEKIANPKHFNRLYQKLACAQKELSRKTKGSNNRQKARLKVAKIHAKMQRVRAERR